MKFGSLFAGIGGFDLGLERAGMECAWQVEIADAPTQVLERYWPHVERQRDIKDTGSRNLPAVDLICGGFPCQDVSVAGRRAGLAGERSGLWFEFHRILEELTPEWVVVENVPGLLSSNEGRDFAAVLRGLVELRYGVCWRVLDAQYFGVAQRRRRLFIVGHIGDGRGAEVLLEPEGGTGDTEAGGEERPRLAAPVKASPPNRRNGGSWPIAEEFVVSAALTAGAHPGSHNGQDDHKDGRLIVAATLTGQMQGQSNQRPPIDEADNLIAFAWQQGVSENDRAYIVRKGDYAGSLGETRHDAIAGHMGVRRLTPTECERLQGFPDGWTDQLSDSARYRALGNAVCVPVVEWIGRRIVEA